MNDQLREVLFRPIVTGAERRKEIMIMSKEDNWHCFMPDETLKDLQMIVHKNF